MQNNVAMLVWYWIDWCFHFLPGNMHYAILHAGWFCLCNANFLWQVLPALRKTKKESTCAATSWSACKICNYDTMFFIDHAHIWDQWVSLASQKEVLSWMVLRFDSSIWPVDPWPTQLGYGWLWHLYCASVFCCQGHCPNGDVSLVTRMCN